MGETFLRMCSDKHTVMKNGKRVILTEMYLNPENNNVHFIIKNDLNHVSYGFDGELDRKSMIVTGTFDIDSGDTTKLVLKNIYGMDLDDHSKNDPKFKLHFIDGTHYNTDSGETEGFSMMYNWDFKEDQRGQPNLDAEQSNKDTEKSNKSVNEPKKDTEKSNKNINQLNKET